MMNIYVIRQMFDHLVGVIAVLTLQRQPLPHVCISKDGLEVALLEVLVNVIVSTPCPSPVRVKFCAVTVDDVLSKYFKTVICSVTVGTRLLIFFAVATWLPIKD